jgi:hypothetical protein
MFGKGELVRMWKEVVKACSKVSSHHLPVETEVN